MSLHSKACRHMGSYVDSDDVDATARTVPQLGGKVLMGPQISCVDASVSFKILRAR